MVRSYKDLRVWQRSVQLALAIYRLTAAFPAEESVWTHQPASAGGCFGTEQHC